MAIYNKPPLNTIPFKFTTGGYSKPSFSSVPFNFGAPTYSQTANLQAAINVMGTHQTSTYTYLKECPTYVIGYGAGIQIIQLPCIYGGIRDVGAYLYGNPEYANLSAYIFAISGRLDLGAYIKSTIQDYKNLGGYVNVFTQDYKNLGGYVDVFIQNYKNLGAYVKSTTQAYKNLGAYAKSFIQDYKNLIAAIRRIDHSSKDLLALLTGELIKGHSDLQSILNVIDVRNLPALLVGELLKGQADLGAGYDKLFLREYINLGAYISSVMTPDDLPATLNVISFENLAAVIRIFQISSENLQAYVNIIQIGNLLASIRGFDIRSLGAMVTGVYGPYDIQAWLNATGGYKNLFVYIKGMIGTQVPIDLQGIVSGAQLLNLTASVFPISPINLIAYLNVVGQTANLLASIVPRIIHLKQAIKVALLEHLDLHAMVNFACFISDHRNLYAYLYPIMKLDLRATIFGWYVDIYSNVKDLALYINTGVYNAEDKISIGFYSMRPKYTLLRLKFKASETYKMFDTVRLLFSGVHRSNLSAVVTGILESLNLSAYIKPVFDWNYSELPPSVNPKTHEIVIDFSAKWRENWRKFVELMFDNSGDSPYHYFYVSGASQVYRVDRDRHWIIRAKSYRRTDSIIERRSVRYKYVFKMSDYANVDEAVRDLIDRVSAYRRVNLGAYINGSFGPIGDLRASITGMLYTNPIRPWIPIRSWIRNLHASIIPDGFSDMSALITGIP